MYVISDISNLSRNDIVVYAQNNGMTLVKRIIVLPTETFELTDEGFFINGELYKEDYEFKGEISEGSTFTKDIEYTLSENEFFVIGDNRGMSMDSRFTGAIKFEEIQGEIEL